MKQKIISFFVMMLFLSIIFPINQAQEIIERPMVNKVSLAHIKIKGSGTEFMVMANFMFGFGKSFFIRLKLEKNSHLEINKFFNSTDIIILDGSYVITMIGFCGYFRHANRITINGIAMMVFWK